jgi:hypothetical protein
MARFCVGDMWQHYGQAGLFLITTNSTLRRDGALVMGRGIARQARERFPGLDTALGEEIRKRCGSLGVYGLLISPRWPQARLGGFQVKRDWGRPADLDLIAGSVTALVEWTTHRPAVAVCLNFPGIGNGGLARSAVWPLLEPLPDSVTIWEYPETQERKR